MDFFTIVMLLSLPMIGDLVADPLSNVVQSRRESRSLDCVRITQRAAHERFPGRVPEPSPRALQQDADAMICTRRFMLEGERPVRDEAILSSLGTQVGALAEAASASVPGVSTWHVESFYPQARVAAKISVAAKTHLAERGLQVSDRVPLLAAGDLVVLGHLPPQEAYRVACARYQALESLKSGDALLGIMIVDPRETQLHAGVCLDGEWRWLR